MRLDFSQNFDGKIFRFLIHILLFIHDVYKDKFENFSFFVD